MSCAGRAKEFRAVRDRAPLPHHRGIRRASAVAASAAIANSRKTSATLDSTLDASFTRMNHSTARERSLNSHSFKF
ncbi:hypothetical protein ACFPK5_38620 [Streptomyces beijiangensis]|uniref:hypothetical protein n=1 Tax=Streptomyces beijiangensis TaxID=163361 RepID=UPI00361C4529